MKEALKLALEALGEILESFEKDGKFCMSSLIRNELFDRLKGTFEKCRAIAEAEKQEPAYWLGYGLQAHTEKPFDGATELYTRPQPKREPLTGDATTFVQRFTDAVAILCGSEPPSDFVTEWLANVDVDGVHRLQEWVLNQDATPAWAQGIGVLDAAHLLASTPVESEQHEDAHGKEAA